jgi:hypothetical protein
MEIGPVYVAVSENTSLSPINRHFSFTFTTDTWRIQITASWRANGLKDKEKGAEAFASAPFSG